MISAGDVEGAHIKQQGQHQPVCRTVMDKVCACLIERRVSAIVCVSILNMGNS